MEKLKSALTTLTNVQIDLKYKNRPVSPLLSYLLLLLGAIKLLRILNSAYFKLLFPQLRKIFRYLFQTRDKLLLTNNTEDDANKWALIYGATNHMGQCAAKVFAKHGFSLILVDSNLDKLQKMRDELIRVLP